MGICIERVIIDDGTCDAVNISTEDETGVSSDDFRTGAVYANGADGA